jgi:hypothetical protein
MARLKISPSVLEAFRKGRLFDRSDAELVEQLTGEFKGNEATSLGSAFHSIIEHGDTVGNWELGTPHGAILHVYEPELSALWAFTYEAVEAAWRFRSAYPAMAHEVRGELETECRGHVIHSPLRVDGVHGARIHEVKTTCSNFTPSWEVFERSAQWRIYLLAFPQAQKVVYTVFQLKRDRKDERLVHFKECHQFAYTRENGMAEYVAREMYELVCFAEARGLISAITLK